MPRNPKYVQNFEDKNNLKNDNPWITSPDFKASIEQNKKSEEWKNPENLFQLLYNQEKLYSAEEKSKVANQFFADLFDGNELEWSINQNGKKRRDLIKLLKKYLYKTDFALKFWQTKYKSGIFGKYGLLIVKDKESNSDESRPNLIPVRIIYKNTINDKISEIQIDFDSINYSNGKDVFSFRRKYSLKNNKLIIDHSLVNIEGEEILNKNLSKEEKVNLDLSTKKFDWDFIPISILKNNYDELPRIANVASKFKMLENYDQTLAILPDWEKGGILFNNSPVMAQNQQQQNLDFIKDVLKKGFVQMNPIEMDGNLMNLAENVVLLKHNSIMQTTKATRDLIWTEIKEDIGLPSLNEVKSAQKTSTEVIAKQFLTSPIIEREKMLMKSFLIDLAKKFLILLSECNIKDKFPEDFNPADLEIDVNFEITTDKNIATTAKQINSTKIEPEVEKKEIIDNEPKPKSNWWSRLFRRN